MSRQLLVVLGSLVVLAGCGQHATPPDTQASSSVATGSSTEPPPSSAAPPAPTTRIEKWVDLQVGDCVTEVPPVDLGAVTVDIVDCATPHQAEVFLLAPIAVNAALADVANQACSAGVTPYTGLPASDFAVTYLIDSRQDRTSNNPLPSTVICLLQSDDQRPATGSARR